MYNQRTEYSSIFLTGRYQGLDKKTSDGQECNPLKVSGMELAPQNKPDPSSQSSKSIRCIPRHGYSVHYLLHCTFSESSKFVKTSTRHKAKIIGSPFSPMRNGSDAIFHSLPVSVVIWV